MRCPERRQRLHLLGPADHVDQRHTLGLAEPHQHLAKVGRGRGVHQRAVAFAAQRLEHAQGGEGIDVPGSPLRRSDTGREPLALGDLQAAVLRVHLAPDHADRLTEERLRLRGRSCRDDDAGALVPRRHGLADPRRSRAQWPGTEGRTDAGKLGRASRAGARHVGTGKEHAEVRWIDWGRLDPDDHLVRLGMRDWHTHQGDLHRPLGLDGGTQLQTLGGSLGDHRGTWAPKPRSRANTMAWARVQTPSLSKRLDR